MNVAVDLNACYFSLYGSYLLFARDPGPEVNFRSCHGAVGEKVVFRVELWRDGAKCDYTDDTTPERMRLSADGGSVDVVFRDTDSVLMEVTDVTLRLYLSCSKMMATKNNPHGFAGDNVPQGGNMIQYNCFPSRIKLMLTAVQGTLAYVEDNCSAYYELAPASGGVARLLIAEYASGYDAGEPLRDNDWYAGRNAKSFADWLDAAYAAPKQYEAARAAAAYTNWASVVKPHGHFKRNAMLMSKRIMTSIWTWDHLFNALALMGDPRAAQDQFAVVFDHQDERGAIPDAINDNDIIWNFCKPPYHGWTLRKMMEMGELDQAFLADIYPRLCKWTEWWIKYRDCDGDGAPEYNNGNDSGWDNSTVFSEGFPVESPDLCALLAVQGDVLAGLARTLGMPETEAEKWDAYSKKMLSVVLDEFWDGEAFFARRALTHERIQCASLLPYMAVIAGHMFPEDMRQTLIARLMRENAFLTPYGLATEDVNSAKYESDGYWLGPIWAPSTLTAIEGLRNMGAKDQSIAIARRFCDTIAKSGMAENFDALTGAPLRDKSYTWTSSVFLLLAGKYLL